MTMPTDRARRPSPRAPSARRRPERRFGYRDGVLALAVGARLTHYRLEPVASDWGRAFRLTKFPEYGDDSYTVCLEETGAATCDCKGHAAYGHCKHADALRTLLDTRVL